MNRFFEISRVLSSISEDEIKNGNREILLPSLEVARDLDKSNRLEHDLIAVANTALYLKMRKIIPD